MALRPGTREVKPDPRHFTGEEHILIMTYHSGYIARLPKISSGLCGEDLRRFATALNVAADRVDKLNRAYEAGEIDHNLIGEKIHF